MSDMPTLRTVRTSRVMVLTVAALLLFSCARAVRPLAGGGRGPSPELAIRCARLTRNVVLEVGAVCASLTPPSISAFREVPAAPAPVLTYFKPSRTRLFVRIWPEHRRSLLRRITLASADPTH